MPMKLGEYYTLEEVAEHLGISKARVRDIISAGDLEVEHFGRTPAVHESALSKLQETRAMRRIEEAKAAREELLRAGFIYHGQPPGGMDGSGKPLVQGEYRRGWWRMSDKDQSGGDDKDDKMEFYAVTSIEALARWRRERSGSAS